MSILIDERTQVLVQGITGNLGRYHSRLMQLYGTRIVAGVTPYRGGSTVNGVPVYDSVEEAACTHRIDASVVMVPAPFAKDALLEAADAGIPLIICVTEGVPLQDMMLVKKSLEGKPSLLIGPHSPGVISPGKCLIGYMPWHIYRPGPVGVVSRSGTFSYQVAHALSRTGLGQSTCVGIGGDPITGVSFVELLGLFEEDPETEVVVLIGEIGRSCEEEAAAFKRDRMRKPVVGMVLGKTAPPGKQMGHAGAIITGGRGTYLSKVQALEEAGVAVAGTVDELVNLVRGALGDSDKVREKRGARG